MKPLSTDEIRRSFLDFFKERNHAEVESSSLVPANDPTLLFTNAGMVQFKDVFTGKETREYVAATSHQKCVRAGGKHNDLENVGRTPRHHTFFEMLGNFSFGDYFKKDAITYAWELITKVWGIPAERLVVTVFRGEDGIPADEEAAALWEATGVAKDRIYRFGKSENFWQMGDTGPQGPCSEIHYCTEADVEKALVADRIEQSDGWVELWNLVFMQFVRETKDGPLGTLPKPSVDTGAGLERLAMVMQSKASNYETDGFKRLLEAIAKDAGKTYGGTDAADDVSMRVVADHARATTFLISDGVLPSNEGRGYVLRRIMRRAIRHGKRLGFDDLFFHRACLLVVKQMVGAFPDLDRAASTIEKWVRQEETSFRRTLDKGLKTIADEMKRLEEASEKALDPDFVATMWDQEGFPIDLTRVIANEHGFAVDEEAAKEALRRKQQQKTTTDLGDSPIDGTAIEKIWFDVRDETGPTAFLGYEHDASQGLVQKVIEQRGHVAVVLEQTPFYGESGGQVGDKGELLWDGGRMVVEDTIKPLPEIWVHRGKVVEGTLVEGTKVTAKVDASLRNQTRKNHSATHLLHLALKEVLGDHVNQKGSLVAPDRLRFDYSHFQPMTLKEMGRIEERVNQLVLENVATKAEVKSLDDAKQDGAVMLFGEKYGDEVRTVRIGQESLELCGGNHVVRAGDIGLFKIVSDSALASGVRRIEAVTGMNALTWVQEQERQLHRACDVIKVNPGQLPERMQKIVKHQKELERSLEEAQAAAVMGGQSEQEIAAEQIGDVNVIFKTADGTPKKALRGVADKLRDKIGSGVVVLTAKDGDQVAMLVAATKDLKGKVHAGNIVKAATKAMGGSGGGRPDFAQGGGQSSKLDAGLAEARTLLESGG